MNHVFYHLDAAGEKDLANRTDLTAWTLASVTTPDELINQVPAGDHAVLLLDWSLRTPDWESALTDMLSGTLTCTPIIVVQDSNNTVEGCWIDASVYRHVVSAEVLRDDFLLPVTLNKLFSDNPFGLEPYLTEGIEPVREVVSHTRQKYGQLEVIERFCELSGVPQRMAMVVVSVVDELLMNAVYHAPVTADGQRRYASRPRSESVELDFHERVELRYACDDRVMAVGITDRFGSLGIDTIGDTIVRCVRGETNPASTTGQGAGLGLYTVFSGVSHLIFNIEPGKRTEVIALLDITSSYRDIIGVPTSLNIFVRE
jgi:hypothetical protein